MGRKITALALAALLALALAGCGERTVSRNDSAGSTTHSADDHTGSAADGGVTDRSGVGDRTADNGVNSGRNGRGLLGSGEANPSNRQFIVPWDEMVQNGRVHDTDGYLLDGENHRSR